MIDRARGDAGPARRPGPRGRRAAAVLAGALCVAALHAAAPRAEARKKKDEPPPPPEVLYEQALGKMAKKRYYAARALLNAALPRIPPEDRDLLPKVQMAIADSFYLDKGFLNYGEALNGYRNFLTYYPQHEDADRVQFQIAMCLFLQAPSPDRDQSLTRQAIEEFRRVETLYPGSPYFPQAREKLREARDRLAEHERLVGDFYQRRGAHRAAVKRYRGLIDQYPDYRRMNAVLLELGLSLLMMGDRPGAEEAFSRLPQDAAAREDRRIVAEARKALAKYDRNVEKLARKGAGS